MRFGLINVHQLAIWTGWENYVGCNTWMHDCALLECKIMTPIKGRILFIDIKLGFFLYHIKTILVRFEKGLERGEMSCDLAVDSRHEWEAFGAQERRENLLQTSSCGEQGKWDWSLILKNMFSWLNLLVIFMLSESLRALHDDMFYI